MYRIGIDVGGTFTDLVAVDEAGQVVLAKATSTPKDPSIGVLDGLGRLAVVLGTDTRRLLQATERIVHGTTVATNALLEHKGARVGLLTTEGHRDVIEMREGLKDDRYNLRLPAPEPLVPRAPRWRRARWWRRGCRASTSRSPPRSCRRSRSTSASAPRSSTPTWARSSPATSRGSARGSGTPATRARSSSCSPTAAWPRSTRPCGWRPGPAPPAPPAGGPG